MTDEVNTPPRPPERPFATLPDRPPLRTIGSPEADMRQAANSLGQARAVELRTAARRDAAIVVSRARQRAGIERSNWSGHDVDVLHAITELLMQVQAQNPQKPDPVFGDGA
jgi:hypothetical protein